MKNNHLITTVINYCSNDYRFIKKCIDEAKKFSHQVIVPVSDHFFDGTKENRDLLNLTYLENPTCEFIEYEFTHKVDEARAILRFGDSSGNPKGHLFGIEDDKGNWLNVKLDKAGHPISGIQGNKPTFPQDGLIVEHIPTHKGIKTKRVISKYQDFEEIKSWIKTS